MCGMFVVKQEASSGAVGVDLSAGIGEVWLHGSDEEAEVRGQLISDVYKCLYVTIFLQSFLVLNTFVLCVDVNLHFFLLPDCGPA